MKVATVVTAYRIKSKIRGKPRNTNRGLMGTDNGGGGRAGESNEEQGEATVTEQQ